MTLEHMFFISQTIAAFATVGALVFVGLEMRNSTHENRHRTIEEMLEDLRVVRGEVAASSELTRVWMSGLQDFAAPPPVDRRRFLLTASNLFSTHEAIFLHYRDGHMTRDMYAPLEEHLCAFLGYPGLQAAWSIRGSFCQKAFRTIVDDKIRCAQIAGVVPQLHGEGSTQAR